MMYMMHRDGQKKIVRATLAALVNKRRITFTWQDRRRFKLFSVRFVSTWIPQNIIVHSVTSEIMNKNPEKK